MNPLLYAHNLAHHFETLLYENLSLSVNEGESIAILGVSGSGKSTILNNLSTLLPPKKGQVSLLGIDDIYALSAKEQLALRRLQLGIVFQAHYLFRGFSGIENLKVASILSKQPIDKGLLESFGIAKVIHQPIGQLSGGQQQRLSIARVLTKKPKIIFADEPTGNLDRQTAIQVMNIMFEYVRTHKAALILATHDQDIAQSCDKIYHLYDKALHSVK
ncbi:ATP-binding cassette domain-containing protein [Helicobacter sp. MIT 21-1697]|uniref:ABC transporter ATP-binding protein n=1 Tax=Helicobacter sp. MIT 21-1697 TaxID=2993733 RepID=UPI00224A6401|nr:ATP-binding cassette domain-containing protein [Helicobacter sp. MIT 21-1697]MCX2717755.1 ATP-binding cassette domain-containing protein [Helicobacter sp. MIT 21-1697]